ncbi:Replication-relaxation [Actinacidiphila yanglinensis]|uniref:Replication-relaxation n=1 Tax=Actinacidiphila yanglinensis TaxID=310779 RepID=A0A1H6DKB1_9ACTN|nr:Replication-relaxation [Actinacidiphila yanglinensis]
MAEQPRRGLTMLGEQLLPVLYQHRLMTTRQLQQLLQPHTTYPVYLRRQLARLRGLGLVDSTLRNRGGGRGELAWYCTPAGTQLVEAAGEVTVRAYRMTPEAAASQLQEHTIAVNDTGLAFVDAARAAGHECGPLDWEPELAHRLRDGGSRVGDEAFLIPDAVLRYTHRGTARQTLMTFFIELDRATMNPGRLAAKLRAYARYQTYIPAPPPGRARPTAEAGTEAWRSRYTAFPAVLFVLTGATPTALARRTADLRALAGADVRLRRAAHRLSAGVTTLQQLQKAGPWAHVVVPVFGPDHAPRNALAYTETTT